MVCIDVQECWFDSNSELDIKELLVPGGPGCKVAQMAKDLAGFIVTMFSFH